MRISTKSTQTECIHIWHYFITVRSFPYVSCDRSVCFLHWKKLKPLNTVRKKWKLVKLKFFRKNLTIFYINMKHPDLKTVLWNRNYFLLFRFRLLKSYGSGSGSDFWKSYGSGSGSYLWKVTIPVPVPAPYLYHKKQIFQKKLFPFYIVSCFTRKKIININKFIVKCKRKNVKWR